MLGEKLDLLPAAYRARRKVTEEEITARYVGGDIELISS
jgi:hypothetical protein